MALTNRAMKNTLIKLCLWIADASMTSHSFRHFCRPSLAHTPILAAAERQGQLLTMPSQELGEILPEDCGDWDQQDTVISRCFMPGLSLLSEYCCVWDGQSVLCGGQWSPCPHGSPPPLVALGPAQSSQPICSSDLSPAWALQDLPWLLSSSSGAALTLLHLTATAEHLKGMAAGLHNSCLDRRALGAQSKCISPHFSWLSLLLLETWRFSRDCLLLGKVSLFVWRKPQNSFNQGRRDCSSPRIVTYLLAAAHWKCRFDPRWGRRGN